jgi:phage protein D
MPLGLAVNVGETFDPQLSEATWVEVRERMGDLTRYRIRYEIEIGHDDFPDLTNARTDHGSILAINVPLSGKNNFLVKGPVTGQRVHLEHGAGNSYVEIEGTDSSIKMSRENKAVLWNDVTDSDAVNKIVKDNDYEADVDSTSGGHFEKKHSLVQRDSDLMFVHRLARRNGFLFWITCDDLRTETAHFKRPAVDAQSSANLDINLTSNTINVLDLTWDVERSTSVVAAQLNLNDKSTIDGELSSPPLAALGSKSLKDITGDTRSSHLYAPVDDSGELQARSAGALTDAGWFVFGTCRTSINALNAVVRANTVVTVQGAGSRHSGKYLVSGVLHRIEPAGHYMDLELVRNAWGVA